MYRGFRCTYKQIQCDRASDRLTANVTVYQRRILGFRVTGETRDVSEVFYELEPRVPPTIN